MCEYCEIEPMFKKDILGHSVYDKDKSQKALDPGGMYSQLVMGTDEDEQVFIEADEGANRLWYPNFCPVCGRDLRPVSPESDPSLAEHFLWLEHDLAMDE